MNKINRKNVKTLNIKTEYHRILANTSYDLSKKYEERIPSSRIIYTLIDNYLEQAVRDIESEM
jgi:hypothetical protein